MLALVWIGVGAATLLIAVSLSALGHAKTDDQQRKRFLLVLLLMALLPTLVMAAILGLNCASSAGRCSFAGLMVFWSVFAFLPASLVGLGVAIGIYLLPLRAAMKAALLGVAMIAMAAAVSMLFMTGGVSFRTEVSRAPVRFS